MITTKMGLVAAGVAAITGAYSAPAQAWGWHGGGRVGYSRPYVGGGYGVRAPYVAPYAYGYAAPVAYGADYGYGYGYGYGAPVVNVGWNRPVYGYGHAGYGWGGGRGWGGGHGYGGGHFGGGRGRR